MMFIQSCFIKKNTAELRRKLEELGYQYGGHDSKSWGVGALYCFDNKYYEIYPAKPSRYHYIVDCSKNEELFLALVALRDDTDINQIYWWNERHLVKCIRDCSSTLNIELTPYYMCQLIDNSDIKFEIPCKELRKATVREIIEHFKK